MSKEIKVNLVNEESDVDFKVNIASPKKQKSKAPAEEAEENETSEEETSQAEDTDNQQDSQSEAQETPEGSEEKPKELSKEEIVNQLLSDRFNVTLDSLSDVLKNSAKEPAETVELTEDVKKYLEFRKETKRGLADFVKLQEDVDQMDSDKILRDYYAQTKPGLDSSDIDYLMNKKFGYDEDSDSEDVIKSRQLEKKEEIHKAKEYFVALKEKYKAPLESSSESVPEEYKDAFSFYSQYKENQAKQEEAQKLQRQSFEERTNKLFNDEFEGFDFKVGEKKLVYKPKNLDEVIKSNSDLTNFIQKHLDDNGNLKDVKAYHKSLSMATNPEAFASFFYEQGKADAVNDVVAGGKNIDMSLRKNVDSSKPASKFRVLQDEAEFSSGLKFRK
jgi:hypothetical protein